MSIPALICPTLNRPELLRSMLDSIDHQIDQVVVIDNGGKVGPSIEAWVDVVHLPHNIGVAASWNLGIKVTPKAPYWLITNDDIEFGPGDLARLEATIDPNAAGIWFLLGMACFAITRHTLNAIGWFDEAVSHPAYNEDVDYCRRLDLAGLPRHEVGFSGTHVGSATIMADPMLRALNGVTHTANDANYWRKWGGHKQGGETFTTPYGRGGHLGDWKPDIEVLRNQAWPRSKEGR